MAWTVKTQNMEELAANDSKLVIVGGWHENAPLSEREMMLLDHAIGAAPPAY